MMLIYLHWTPLYFQAQGNSQIFIYINIHCCYSNKFLHLSSINSFFYLLTLFNFPLVLMFLMSPCKTEFWKYKNYYGMTVDEISCFQWDKKKCRVILTDLKEYLPRQIIFHMWLLIGCPAQMYVFLYIMCVWGFGFTIY